MNQSATNTLYLSFWSILTLFVIVLLLLSVQPLVDFLFNLKYTYHIYPVSPHLSWDVYKTEEKQHISFLTNKLYFFFALLSFLLLAYLRAYKYLLKLRIKETLPTQGELLSILLNRCYYLLFIGSVLYISVFLIYYVVFQFLPFTDSQLLLLSFFCYLNFILITPYIACIGIYEGLTLKNLLLISFSSCLLFAIGFKLNLSPYRASIIGNAILTVLSTTKLASEFKALETYFGIKGKTYKEMTTSTTLVPYFNKKRGSNLSKHKLYKSK